MGAEMTFGQLDQNSAAIGAWLQSKGFAKGTRVAIMMPNVLQYPVAMAGVLRAGYTVVNVNPLYTPRELEHQLKDSGAEAIFILENFATTLQQVIDKVPTKTVVVCAMGDMLPFPKSLIVNFVVRNVKKMVPAFSLPNALRWNDVLADGMKMNLKQVECSHSDVAFLQYTGGTTGVSKGATLTHKQRDRQHAAGRSLVPASAGETEARRADDHSDRAAAVSHLRADVLRAAVDAYRRQESVDSESARYSGVRQGTRASTSSACSLRSTRCSTGC